MITIRGINISGLPEAIYSMRNPMNSWAKGDSYSTDFENGTVLDNFVVGPNDHKLAMRLVNAGTEHCKFRRMINVYVDICAPLYWWKQFDTYKIGTVCNSCSTMHRLHSTPFSFEQFSFDSYSKVDRLNDKMEECVSMVVEMLNTLRQMYLLTKDKTYWKAMVELLPESYNQQRTIMLNYEVLANIYRQRKNHKLGEWHIFCEWIKDLPYSEFIIGGKSVEKGA